MQKADWLGSFCTRTQTVTSAVEHFADSVCLCDSRAPGVKWNDIAGLGNAKELLRENIALPLALPELFTGIRRPVKVRAQRMRALRCL